jgi:myo-inositol-1(or 4)-monophosphatase
VTDWLAVCRACVDDVRAALERLPTRAEREPVVGRGRGGDDTTAIDEAAEDAILARLRALDEPLTIVSEEAGVVGAGATVVVVDPIDGSFNAKRGLPFFAVSIAVANGHTLGDVDFGYVYDFAAGEEWVARRGSGAMLDGEPLGGVRPKEPLEILAFEATRTDLVARHAPAVAALVPRVRIFGSLALALCQLAAGRIDAVCSLKENGARSVDIAAAQLIVRELGYSVALFDDPRPLGDAELDLVGRSRVAAAATDELCAAVAAALVS